MKIRTFLADSEELIKMVEETIKQKPELAEEFKKFGKNYLKSYLELDTGGELDELPLKAQEAFKQYIAIILRSFGNKLLAALNFDLAAKDLGNNVHPGFDAIEKGLTEIERGLEVAEMITEPSPRATA